MSGFHLRQIENHLRLSYIPQLDGDDLARHPPEQREKILLSRALAAFSLVVAAEADPADSVSAVIDRHDDNGIDAIYVRREDSTIYLVQAKWHGTGHGSIERGDLQKFLIGFRDLINGRFDRFGERLNRFSRELEAALLQPRTRFCLIVSHTGVEVLSKVAQRDIADILDDVNDTSEVAEFRVLTQRDFHDALVKGATGAPVALDLTLFDWGYVEDPYQAYYGQMSAADIADWHSQFGRRLFNANIRVVLPDSEINAGLKETLLRAPSSFWYFNNGVTALAQSIEKLPKGGNTRTSGQFSCTGFSIVNGAQTVGAIAAASAKDPEAVATARVHFRVIALGTNPPELLSNITRANNTQNKIDRRDFVALDHEQERIRRELLVDGITYAYKSGDTVLGLDSGLDLVEATLALACASADVAHAVQAKREIGRLWDDISKPPYRVLFNAKSNSSHLWRLVQAHRVVERALESIRKDKKATRRDRLIATHGNRFIAHVVLLQNLATIQQSALHLPSELVKHLSRETQRAHAIACGSFDEQFRDSYPANTFKNATKCRTLQRDVLSKYDGLGRL